MAESYKIIIAEGSDKEAPGFRKCRVGLEEKEEDGAGMHTLPLMLLEVPGEEITEAPARADLCREMTAFMRRRIDGRNVYKRGTGSLEKTYSKREVPRDNSNVRFTGQWPEMVPVERHMDGKRKYKRNRDEEPKGESRKRRKIELDVAPKYGGGGLISSKDFESMELHPEAEGMAVSLANSSLASSTWRSYSAAWKVVERCREDWKVPMGRPWSAEKCINFVSWCRRRGIKAASCKQYLSGIKKLHSKEGLTNGWGEDPKVKMILRGYENLTEDARRVRVAMDPKRLWFLKLGIAKRPGSVRDRRMLWFISVIMLKASLRASECMSDKVGEVKLEKVLQWQDIEKREEVLDGERVQSIVLKIKAPKEQKNLKTIKVQLWKSEDFIDPVTAFDKLVESMKGELPRAEDPVARWEDGSMLTKQRFNRELKTMLGSHFKYEEGAVSSHSFRAGLITLMQEFGCTEQELMDQGRWSSAAFALYVKSGRGEMRRKQLKLSRRVEEMIGEKMLNAAR